MCQNCDESEEEMKQDWIKLRYIGGRHKKYPYRGPYLTYETGKVYLVPPENKTLLYWETVDKTEEADEETVEVEVDSEAEVDVEVVVETETEPEVQPPSPGLRKFDGAPPTEKDFIMSMDVRTLRIYIEGQGGKVDGRWGLDKLREEALKDQ